MSGASRLFLKNLLLPIFCKQCGLRLLTEENGFFCPTCWDLSPGIHRPFCLVCGQPQEGRAGFGAVSNFTCATCRDRQSASYDRIYGAAHYDGAVKEAIRLLKFHGKRRLAAPIARRMADFARLELETEVYDALVPVPLHRVRHRARGFNQAALLAGQLAPVFPNAAPSESLRRIRPTRAQSLIKDPDARRANVVGAFAVDSGVDFTGKIVLLIDDVVTTGGTVDECASALKRAGASRVDVFAAALPVLQGYNREFPDDA